MNGSGAANLVAPSRIPFDSGAVWGIGPSWASVIGVWALVGGLLYGLGCLVARGLDAPGERVPGLARFWLGWAAALAFLQIWHFWLPIDSRVQVALAPLALAGLYLDRSALRGRILGVPTAAAALAAAALAAALWAIAAALALHRPSNPDTCLYYLATIRWFERYPIVPGLGNLHLRLAFNHAYYLYASLFDLGPVRGNGEHLANGLLLLGVLVPACIELVRALRFRQFRRNSACLTIAVGGVLLDVLFSDNLPSPTADVAVATASAVIMLLAMGPALDGDRFTAPRLRAVIVLSIAATIAKPSAVIASAPFSIFAAFEAWRSSTPGWRRTGAIAAVAAALLVVPWLIRGWVLSGYPLFPSEVGNLGLSWRIPAGVGRKEFLYERAFARLQAMNDPRGEQTWVAHWFSLEWAENREFLLPAISLLVAGAAAAVLAIRGRRTPAARTLVVTFAAVAFWWLLAPHPRFALPLLWVAASSTVLVALDLSRWKETTTAAVKLALSLAVVAGALDPVGQLRISFAQGFEPPGPERFAEGRLGSGEPIHVLQGCCYDAPCVRGDPGKIYSRRPGHPEAGYCSFPGCADE